MKIPPKPLFLLFSQNVLYRFYTSLSVLLLTCASSCRDDCPAFNSGLLPWMEFGNSGKIVFENQNQDSLCFNLWDVQSSPHYAIDENINNPCHSFAICRARDTSTSNTYFEYSIDKFRRETRFSVKCSRSDSCINYYCEYYGETSLTFKKLESEIQTVNINGTTYQEALVILRYGAMHSENNVVDKCIIVKGLGLMQIFESSGIVWTRRL